METKKVLPIPAYIDVTDATKTKWVARVAGMAGEPFVGLFAFGANFAAAREALARATTRKSFSVAALAADE
jgi:hypothetical protein